MKLNAAMVVASLPLLVGWYFQQKYLWVPATVLAAAFVDLLARAWVMRDDRLIVLDFPPALWKLGLVLKGILALVGVYAMLGQVVCLALVGWWLLT